MEAAAPELIVPAARQILSDLSRGEDSLQAEPLDALMARMMVIANVDVAKLALLTWDEPDALAEIQRFRATADFIEGPVGAKRRASVRLLAPHRAEAFEALEARVVAWYRGAIRILEDRVAFIRASHRIMDEHEETFRALAQ